MDYFFNGTQLGDNFHGWCINKNVYIYIIYFFVIAYLIQYKICNMNGGDVMIFKYTMGFLTRRLPVAHICAIEVLMVITILFNNKLL